MTLEIAARPLLVCRHEVPSANVTTDMAFPFLPRPKFFRKPLPALTSTSPGDAVVPTQYFAWRADHLGVRTPGLLARMLRIVAWRWTRLYSTGVAL